MPRRPLKYAKKVKEQIEVHAEANHRDMIRHPVQFANKLNQISFSPLNSNHQNLFFYIVCRLNNQDTKEIEITATQLAQFYPKNYTQEDLLTFAKQFKESLFKIDFTEISADGLVERSTNVFNTFEIHSTIENEHKKLERIRLSLNQGFTPIFNQLAKNFTEFELTQFTLISGKYSKILFRLLVQYKNTGSAYFDWNDLKKLLGIPESFKSFAKIEARILKPAIKDLTWSDGQTDLFIDYQDEDCPLFKGLTYEKIKKTNKKTSPIIALRFSFTPKDKFKDQIRYLPFSELNNLLANVKAKTRKQSLLDLMKRRNFQVQNLSNEQLQQEIIKGQDSLYDGNQIMFEISKRNKKQKEEQNNNDSDRVKSLDNKEVSFEKLINISDEEFAIAFKTASENHQDMTIYAQALAQRPDQDKIEQTIVRLTQSNINK